MISDDTFLNVDQVLAEIKSAIVQQIPFSFVRVGDGENLILAQNSVWSLERVLKEKWPRQANQGKKGVTLPNLLLRDQMVEAIKKADIVGIPFKNNDPIRAPKRLKRQLTDDVFSYFSIQPKKVCHTFTTRVLPQKKEFWQALQGKRVLVISRWCDKLKEKLGKDPYHINVNLTFHFSRYEQLEEALTFVQKNKDNFDVALVSCGVNSVVLVPKLVELTGKVGIDFGKSAAFMLKRKAGLEHHSDRANLNLLP